MSKVSQTNLKVGKIKNRKKAKILIVQDSFITSNNQSMESLPRKKESTITVIEPSLLNDKSSPRYAKTLGTSPSKSVII